MWEGAAREQKTMSVGIETLLLGGTWLLGVRGVTIFLWNLK